MRAAVWREYGEYYVTYCGAFGKIHDVAGPFDELIDAVGAACRGCDDVDLSAVSKDSLHPAGLVHREAD